MAIVRPLSGLLNVDVIVDEVEGAIQSGVLPPGGELSLVELAGQRDVRVGVLREVMGRLERDGLLRLHGDAVVVSPLDPDEYEQTSRLRRAIQLDLFERSIGQVHPRTFARLAMLIPDELPPGLPDGPDALRRWGLMMATVSQALSHPAASRGELEILRQAYAASHRYNNLGWARLRRDDPEPSAESLRLRQEHLDHLRDLVAACRSGASGQVRELMSRHDDNARLVATQSFIPGYLARSASSTGLWPRALLVPRFGAGGAAQRPVPPAPEPVLSSDGAPGPALIGLVGPDGVVRRSTRSAAGRDRRPPSAGGRCDPT